MSDLLILAAGLQTVRTIGVKRMIPLLAIGGIAFGLMDALKRSIAGGASSAWEKGGAEALLAGDFVPGSLRPPTGVDSAKGSEQQGQYPILKSLI